MYSGAICWIAALQHGLAKQQPDRTLTMNILNSSSTSAWTEMRQEAVAVPDEANDGVPKPLQPINLFFICNSNSYATFSHIQVKHW